MSETDSNFNRIEGELRQVENYIDELETKLSAAQNELADWREAAEIAIAGGHDDEDHCTCVPVLRARIGQLEREISETAEGLKEYGGGMIADADVDHAYTIGDVRASGGYILRSAESLLSLVKDDGR